MNPNQEQSASKLRLIQTSKVGAASNFVPRGAVLKGDLEAQEDLSMRIEGNYTGTIDMKEGGFLHIGASAVINCESIAADFIYVEGTVQGNIHARKAIEIAPSARIKGKVCYDQDMDFHAGARVTGTLQGPADA